MEQKNAFGFIKGVDSKGTLNATDSLTRAQFCQMLYNAGILGCVYPAVVWAGGSASELAVYLKSYYRGDSTVEG